MSSILEKLNLLGFLVRSGASVVRESDGTFRLSTWLFSSLFSAGPRATIRELVARAAYARREDPALYSDWVSRGEPSRAVVVSGGSLEGSSEVFASRNTDLLLFLPRVETGLVLNILRSIENDQRINCIYLISDVTSEIVISRGDHDFDFTVECMAITEVPDNAKLLASRSVAARNFILMHSPGNLDSRFLAACQQLHSNKVDAVFCDHDQLRENIRCKPVFKSGYSEALLWDPAYIPVGSVTATVFNSALEASTFDDGRGAQAKGFELIVRCFSASTKVTHLPGVHFHLALPCPPWSNLVEDYKAAKSVPVIDLTRSGSFFPEHYVVPDSPFKTSIVIPTRDRFDLLAKCINSILEYPPAGEFEILILDNQSCEPATLEGLATYARMEGLKVLACDYDFNWARLTNDGIRASTGDVIVLLNNDTVVLTQDWCDRLAWLALEDGAGTVGALLLYPGGAIQHAGVVAGYGGYADHIYIGEAISHRPDEMFVSPLVRRDVLACTGACLAFSRKTFELVGEFDESLIVVGDVDFCLRSYEAGLRNIYDPSIRLTHEESKTRIKGLPRGDRDILKTRLARFIEQGDPFYNPNLSLSTRSPMPVLW